MIKIQTDPLNDLRRKPKDKANTVFLKLYVKRRGKYKGWGDIISETLIPEGKSDIRNEMEVS